MSSRTANIANATTKSTMQEPMPESGNTNLGKYTFEMSWALPTRELLILLSTLLKKFHPNSPANENTK